MQPADAPGRYAHANSWHAQIGTAVLPLNERTCILSLSVRPTPLQGDCASVRLPHSSSESPTTLSCIYVHFSSRFSRPFTHCDVPIGGWYDRRLVVCVASCAILTEESFWFDIHIKRGGTYPVAKLGSASYQLQR